MNALARSDARLRLSPAQIALTNEILQPIIRLLSARECARNLHLLPTDDPVTVLDALMLLGHYKAALRSFRVEVLGESTYRF